jgi:GT2 family glycosyltransferase
VDVSVVIPTLGRPDLLRDTLESLSLCEPRPAEVLVVDQSPAVASRAVVDQVDLPGARVLSCPELGIGRAANAGLRNASQSVALRLDDDCTVRADWVEVAWREMERYPDGMISGRVLPAARDPRMVPSTVTRETPRDYTGDPYRAMLFSGNMACPREAVLSMGGFDERIVPAAEDNDLCYRWVRAGRRLRHVPELVVWHQAWRSPEQLERMYVGYYKGNGMFYAKHLRHGDLRILRFLAADYYGGLRSLLASLLRSTPRWTDPHRGVFPGLMTGLWNGWREFKQND